MSSSFHPIVKLLFLLGESARAVRRLCEEESALNQWELTPASITALHHIARCQGLKQTELAERMKIEPTTLGVQLDRLEERGLIERRIVSGDRRSKRIILTQDGHAVLAETNSFLAALFLKATNDIAPEQMAGAMETLTAIQKNLTATEGQIHRIPPNAEIRLGR